VTTSGRRLPLLLGAALAFLTLAAWLPALQNGFINLDDPYYVTTNPQVRPGITRGGLAWAMTAKVASNWHPLTMLSHILDCQLFGLDPAGHHATSLLLHLANALLLFEVLRRMTGAAGRSAAVAALFAVHPTHVESVAWVAERKDVLSALFWLLAMGAWARYARAPAIGRYLLVALLMILGLMAKPMVVTLPFALLLLDIWPLDRLRLGWRRLLIEKLPLLALSAASSLITLRYQETSLAPLDVVPWSLRAANALVSYVAYLGKIFLPRHLAVFYPIPLAIPAWKVAGAALLLAALTALAVWRARWEPWLLTGWLWFLGTLVPVIGLVQVGRQAMADRYTYIPSIGLFLAVVWSVAWFWRSHRAALATVSAIVILALAAVTRVQIGYWSDSATLFRHALAVTGDDNYLAHIGLGKALMAEKDWNGAAEQFRAALALYPHLSEARAGLESVRRAKEEGSCCTKSSTPR
jgi:tetratricopeptide (TPR) repeat protein